MMEQSCSTKHCTNHGIQFHSSYRSTTFALERASGKVGLDSLNTAYKVNELVHDFLVERTLKKPAGKSVT